jgi:hypothetical protein
VQLPFFRVFVLDELVEAAVVYGIRIILENVLKYQRDMQFSNNRNLNDKNKKIR